MHNVPTRDDSSPGQNVQNAERRGMDQSGTDRYVASLILLLAE
jgi:hypothetical protein